MVRVRVFAVQLFLALALPVAVFAQIRSAVIVSGLPEPLALVPDPALPNVQYIVQKHGLVRVLLDGQLRAAPFADLRALVSTGGERGLLGMAFSPDASSGRVFFNYTDVNGHTVISRYRRQPLAIQIDPATRLDFAWPTGQRVILQPYANHNGGHLAFGPDGYLYVGLGDGGSSNDPLNNAQNPGSLLGKMLRLDVNVPESDPTGYRVPPDNPFVDNAPIPALGEIWDFGLRNPWRYSFDDVGPGATGALIIGDVGQGAREEIDYEPRGAGGRNYGWRLREGSLATPGVPTSPPAAFEPLVNPLFDYGRSEGRAVTGGYVYRGTALGPQYQGRYFFADFVSSRVWSLGLSIDPATGEATPANLIEHTSELGGSLGGIASFGRDLQGELYLLTFAGQVRKLIPPASPAPNPPERLQSVVNGSTVTVRWSAPTSGPAPAAYQLEAGSVPGGANLAVVQTAATALTFPGIPTGTYYARVRSIGAGAVSAPSNEVTIIVESGGCPSPPAPTSLAASVTNQLVTLSWSSPSSPATFAIEAGSAPGLANLAILGVDGSSRAVAVQAPPGQYYVRVRAQNACGASAASNEIVVLVP